MERGKNERGEIEGRVIVTIRTRAKSKTRMRMEKKKRENEDGDGIEAKPRIGIRPRTTME